MVVINSIKGITFFSSSCKYGFRVFKVHIYLSVLSVVTRGIREYFSGSDSWVGFASHCV